MSLLDNIPKPSKHEETRRFQEIADMLETVSANGWTLMDLSMREAALEEIYVKLMTNE